MSYLIKPKNYKPLLDLKQTELGIKQIKEFFQLNLSSELRLRRVTAPLFVLKGMGINDDLNGIERPVSFPIKDLGDAQAEVVHSLAKWKRLTLADYNIEPGYGIYTDMNAIRSDEELGNLHSLYVDQWDWERVITNEDRNVDFLKEIVNRIYAAMIRTEYMVYEMYPQIKPCLPQKLHFIHSEELRQLYPNLEPTPFPCLSVAVSVNPVCVCFTFAKLISEKYKPVSGPKICVKNVKNLIYTLYNSYERTNRRKLENTLTA